MRNFLLFLLCAFSLRAALPAYRVSSGSTTSNLDTTGAKLIVIQCNSFAAACHTTTFADSASNTYTAGTRHIGTGSNANNNLTWFWVFNPTTSTTQNWTSSGSDSIYIAVYGAPSGGTGWATDSTATGYDTQGQNSGTFTTISITPSVTGDIILTGQSDDALSTAETGNLTSPGATNAAPIVYTLSSVPTNQFIFGETFSVAGSTCSPACSGSGYNITSTVTALTTTTVTANNGVAPGQPWSSGGTLTGMVRFANTPSGSCQFTLQNQQNATTSKMTGSNLDTVACASTSAQVISWYCGTTTLFSVIAFKPVTSAAATCTVGLLGVGPC